jgi:hypothetical protein
LKTNLIFGIIKICGIFGGVELKEIRDNFWRNFEFAKFGFQDF